MLMANPDALVCDLAETYHIYDYRAYPTSLIATLAVGLGPESRIKRYLSQNDLDIAVNTLLLAAIFDALNLLLWSKTSDGQKNINRPNSLANTLLGKPQSNDSVTAFATGEDFEQRKQEILGKGDASNE